MGSGGTAPGGVERGPGQLAALATLAEPLRRRLFDAAASQPDGVTRDGAAATLGVARSVAAFHLDKLVAAGLLEVEHRRPPGRGGPGAGRPAKWYRRSAREVTVSVPERHYEIAAEVLADAAEKASRGIPADDALHRAARGFGRRLGASSSEVAADVASAAPGDRLVDLLARHGYEPHRAGDTIWLANCPFEAVAAGHRPLVCGMNLDLIRGLAEATGLPPDAARLDARPGRCCVTVAA